MIKLFVTDIDSTLTDGFYYTSEDGNISKSFFTRDFWGLHMLSESGVRVCIITAGSDDVIDQQCLRAAKYADVIKGTYNKVKSIRDRYIYSGPGFSWDEIAYIADDVFDIELLSKVGICCCPHDAAEEVLRAIETQGNDAHISSLCGGKGCVREFADYVLKINEVQNGQ